jgi:ankyrin repeat protein
MAPVNAIDNEGATALSLAVSAGHCEAASKLYEHGADASAVLRLKKNQVSQEMHGLILGWKAKAAAENVA